MVLSGLGKVFGIFICFVWYRYILVSFSWENGIGKCDGENRDRILWARQSLVWKSLFAPPMCLWKYWRFPFTPSLTHKMSAHENLMISIEISILGKDYQKHAMLEVDFYPLWLCGLRILTSNYGSPQIMNRTYTSNNGSSKFMDHLSFWIVSDYELPYIVDRFKWFDLISLTFGQLGWNLYFFSPDLWLSGSYYANIFRY